MQISIVDCNKKLIAHVSYPIIVKHYSKTFLLPGGWAKISNKNI